MSDFGRSRRLSAVMGSNSGVSESSYQSFVLKRGVGDLVRPSWEHPTVFRILPGLNPDNPAEFDPWRLSMRQDDYGQWFYPVDVANVSCEANNKASRSWILKDPFDNSYNSMLNPLVLLRNAVKSAINQRLPYSINWLSLVQGGQGRGEELAGPAACWLIRCFLLEHAGKPCVPPRGFNEEDRTVYMMLKVSAVNALKRAMEQKKDNFRGDPSDIASHYVFGDPVGLEDGAYVTLFNREKDPRQNSAPSGGFNPFQQGGGRGGYGGDRQVKGYDCFLTKDYHGGSANLVEHANVVRSKVIEWPNAVHIPDNEEQVRYLEQVYRPYSDMLVFALDDAYGNILEQGLRREGLTKLGRMRPTEAAFTDIRQQPVEPVHAPAPAQAPVQAATRPAASPFGAPAAPRAAEAAQPAASPFAAQGWPSNVVPPHRSSESPNSPTDTRGTEEANPTVASKLVTQNDVDAAMRLVAKARESMRGGAMPQPNSGN